MRRLATLGSVAAAIIYTSPATAEDGAVDMDVYGTLLPFFESVGTSGATPTGTMGQASLVQSGNYSGYNHERRFRMTSGTSHIGFRGFLPIAGDDFKLIWQVESPTPIDGEGPSNWANRNSHVGFGGWWGTVAYGNWDTPMRWVTVTSVNPIKGGYTGDMTPIIGSPGHGTPAWNSDQAFYALMEFGPNRAGFFRHEANTVQYWSPEVAGFSLRAMYAANEHKTFGSPIVPGQTQSVLGYNPYLLSGSVGYDNSWLRVRYAYEVHNDYFGMANLGAGAQAFGPNFPSAQDDAHLGLVAVKINAGTDYQTRIVATGDYLSYHTDATAAGVGAANEFSRASVYALLQQSFWGNHVWLAVGHATEGKCHITGAGNENACTTTGLGANYGTLGLMHDFTPAASIYGLGYAIENDYAARYSTFPMLGARVRETSAVDPRPSIGDTSAGSDVFGFGIGFVYTFTAKLLGGDGEASKAPPPAAEKPTAAAAVEPEPPEAEPPPPAPEPAAAEEPAAPADADAGVAIP